MSSLSSSGFIITEKNQNLLSCTHRDKRRGLAISDYLVEILNSGDAWASEPTCSGNIFAQVDLSFKILMANLAASPHSLSFDRLFEV